MRSTSDTSVCRSSCGHHRLVHNTMIVFSQPLTTVQGHHVDNSTEILKIDMANKESYYTGKWKTVRSRSGISI